MKNNEEVLRIRSYASFPCLFITIQVFLKSWKWLKANNDQGDTKAVFCVYLLYTHCTVTVPNMYSKCTVNVQ